MPYFTPVRRRWKVPVRALHKLRKYQRTVVFQITITLHDLAKIIRQKDLSFYITFLLNFHTILRETLSYSILQNMNRIPAFYCLL